ncbi:MAG: metallophosphoesterase [Chloroflexota bacterium]
MVETRGRADGLLIIAVVVVGVALLVTARLGPRPGFAGPTDSAAASPSTTPANIPSGAPHEVLLAVGDIAYCDSSADDQVGELAARLEGTIALLGDIAYPRGSSDDFARCFDPTWGPLRDRLRPAPGNHEYETKRASGYFSYFGAGAGDPTEGWYSYDLGGWHLVALNSVCDAIGGCGNGSRQLAWLVADLEAHPVACTLAYWHHPRYSSGRHGDDDMTDALWDALAGANADLVLFGHDHDYERTAPIDGMRSFVVGTGGRSLYAWPGAPGPHTEVRANDTYGLLELTLAAADYSWRFISAGGGSFTDAGSGTCR